MCVVVVSDVGVCVGRHSSKVGIEIETGIEIGRRKRKREKEGWQCCVYVLWHPSCVNLGAVWVIKSGRLLDKAARRSKGSVNGTAAAGEGQMGVGR